ncbi:MAG: hypothetical protein M3458_19165 [Acidobacteriota bacterium]|nr:hypothetical protein [Acidobacteriota bacterium]
MTEPARKKRHPLLSLALVLATGTTAVAQFGIPQIVYDPIHEAVTAAGWVDQAVHMLEQLERLQRQIDNQIKWADQFTEFDQYRKIIDGKWRAALGKLPGNITESLSRTSTPTEWGGWQTDEFKKVNQTVVAAQALDELRRTLDNNRTSRQIWLKLRDNLETVYGDVPVTTNGISVEAAHREMATASMYAGDLYKALNEKQQNIHKLRADINSGTLPPGDLERYMTLLESERADADLLAIQTTNQGNRLVWHQLGLQAQIAGTAERNRLQDREDRLQLMGSIYFSPARPQDAAGVQ